MSEEREAETEKPASRSRSRSLGARARTRDSEIAGKKKARQQKKRSGTKQLVEKTKKESLDRHASVRVRARGVNHQDKAERVRFIAGLGKDYVRGETPGVLAEVWGMKLPTVETDASTAWLLIKLQADKEVAQATYWQDVYEELEQMQPLRRRAAEVLQEGLDGKLYQRIPDGEGGDMLAVVDPRGLKELSEALSELAQATDRCRDKIGKGSGVLTSSTTININAVLAAPVPVDVLGDELKVAELTASYGRIVEMILSATSVDALKLAVRNELRGLRGKDPVVVEAPALPAGGETP